MAFEPKDADFDEPQSMRQEGEDKPKVKWPMERPYMNVIVLGTIFAAAACIFSWFVGDLASQNLQKSAFIVMVTLGPGYLVMAANMALQTTRVDGRALPNPTAWLIVLLGIAVIGITIYAVDVSVYSDMVFEGVAGGVSGTMLAVLNAFGSEGEAD